MRPGGAWWAAACAQTVWAQQHSAHDPFAEGGHLEEPELGDGTGWDTGLGVAVVVFVTLPVLLYQACKQTEQAPAPKPKYKPPDPVARDPPEARYLGFPTSGKAKSLPREAKTIEVKNKKFRHASNRRGEQLLGSELRLAPDEDGED